MEAETGIIERRFPAESNQMLSDNVFKIYDPDPPVIESIVIIPSFIQGEVVLTTVVQTVIGIFRGSESHWVF